MTRIVSLLPIALAACLGVEADPGACGLAAESNTCPECSSGPSTCTFGATSVTENSCGDCQARSALYTALCDAGEEATREEIVEGTECVPTVCEVWYDACTDACTPTCVLASEIPETTCDVACSTPIDPPGACDWNGAECAWVP